LFYLYLFSGYLSKARELLLLKIPGAQWNEENVSQVEFWVNYLHSLVRDRVQVVHGVNEAF
jgi:hypothetical protein